MSTPENLPEIYRTHTTKGARYHTRGTHPAIAHRLFPLAKDAAELAIAQGAVVYEKRIGEHWILAEEATALDAAQHAGEQHDRDEERRALLEERADACERFLAGFGSMSEADRAERNAAIEADRIAAADRAMVAGMELDGFL